MALPNLEEVMLEPLLFETYLPAQCRKSQGKTRPMGGGRMPLKIARWDDFEQLLEAWWSQGTVSPRSILAGITAPQSYPKVFLQRGYITKEDGVRAALTACIFAPVNSALSSLGIEFLLNETESVKCVKSNVDWGGFLFRRSAAAVEDKFVRCHLPIEVKPPWQFKLDDVDHVVDLLSSCREADRNKVRFGIAQILLYMILEEAEYGVLCSKEQFVFLKRIGMPEEKGLLISRTFGCKELIGIRRRLLFICQLAKSSKAISRAIVDRGGLTPLERKVVTPKGITRQQRIPPTQVRVQPDRRAKRRADGETGESNGPASSATELNLVEGPYQWVYLSDDGPPLLYAQDTHGNDDLEGRGTAMLDVEHWYEELMEFDLMSLELGSVLSSSGRVIVRGGVFWGAKAVIKMFDLIDGDAKGTLSMFYSEVRAYTVLKDLQGAALPHLRAYGTLWGGYLGFVALEVGGVPFTREQLRMHPELMGMAVTSLECIHAHEVLHGDLSFNNMLVSPDGKNVFFVDFAMCSFDVKEDYLKLETKELVHLLEDDISASGDE